MSRTILRARQMSLALLVIAVVDHGNLTIECSGSTPNSSGLLRLGRDLMRRSGAAFATGHVGPSDDTLVARAALCANRFMR